MRWSWCKPIMQWDWRHAPFWVSVLLSLAALADVVHFWSTPITTVTEPLRPVARAPWLRVPGNGPARIVAAHLFGAQATNHMVTIQETGLVFTLSGVFAVRDPGGGYAILAEKGRPARLYRAGALLDGQAVRLQQVFADHVILQVDGQQALLRFPRRPRPVAAEVAQVTTDDSGGDASLQSLAPSDSAPSAGETWLSNLHLDMSAGGMVVHPERRVQRAYGLSSGDVVTAVDGVPVADPDAVRSALQDATGSASMTFMHDGVPVTVNIPQSN